MDIAFEVRIFIDGEDITEFLFGAESFNVSDSLFIFRDLDLTPFLGSEGNHLLTITGNSYGVDLEARVEIV
jgi:hypothetical protein